MVLITCTCVECGNTHKVRPKDLSKTLPYVCINCLLAFTTKIWGGTSNWGKVR